MKIDHILLVVKMLRKIVSQDLFEKKKLRGQSFHAVRELFWVLQDIYKRGGRKFGFINLLPFGCAPGIRIVKAENNGSCLEEASSLVKLHNKALSKLLRKLEKQLKGFKYSLYNFNINLRQRMNHPSKYGMSYLITGT